MGIGLVNVQLKDLVRTTIEIELLHPIPSLYSVWLVGFNVLNIRTIFKPFFHPV